MCGKKEVKPVGCKFIDCYGVIQMWDKSASYEPNLNHTLTLQSSIFIHNGNLWWFQKTPVSADTKPTENRNKTSKQNELYIVAFIWGRGVIHA